MKTKFIAIAVLLAELAVGCGQDDLGEHMVLLPVDGDPTVAFRVLLNVGSQNDPSGKEGLAALTASVITGGSTTEHSYEEILELLYPMASDISDRPRRRRR